MPEFTRREALRTAAVAGVLINATLVKQAVADTRRRVQLVCEPELARVPGWLGGDANGRCGTGRRGPPASEPGSADRSQELSCRLRAREPGKSRGAWGKLRV
jgi:hypothetical protein